MTYSTTKFEVATSNGLGGDTFIRNVTDGRTYARTDGRTDRQTDERRTDFDTRLIYPFFLKKKAGIISVRYCMVCAYVREDNPRDLASGLSPIHTHSHTLTVLLHQHACALCEIVRYLM